MSIPLLLTLICALLTLAALWRGWRTLEALAQPAMMLSLCLWLYTATGLAGSAAWFGAGLLCWLGGEVVRRTPERHRVIALAGAFAGVLAYTIGLNTPLRPVSAWSLLLALVIGLGAARLIRRILGAARERTPGLGAAALTLYGGALTLLLLAALLTLSDTTWDAAASVLIAGGALALAAAETLRAWDGLVQTIQNARALSSGLHAVGQLALIAGVVIQFT
jgi:hypothetical protein